MSSKSSAGSGREATLAKIAAQNQSERRSGRLVYVVTSVIIVAVLAAVGVAIAIAVRQNNAAAGADPANLTSVSSGGGSEVSGYAVGPDDGDVTVTIFEDFQCPACKAFEEQLGSYVAGLPDDGVRVVYHPVAFLDRYSGGTRYSTRSSSAAACLANEDTAGGLPVFLAFKDLLYANQPAEGGTGLTDDQLAGFAAQAGASEAALGCIREESFRGYATRSTRDAQDAGVSATPTIWVDGEPLANYGELQAAVEAAKG